MLDKNTIIKVTNRGVGSVGYQIPDMFITRFYNEGETKEVTFEELTKLSYTKGGKNLLKSLLVMHNEEAVEEILGEVEPEYWYTKEDVKKLLLEGSSDALRDCLDFAPEGVIDLVKRMAVTLRINDLEKRDIIFQATGFNVNNAIQIAIWAQEDEPKEEEHVRRRRVSAESKPEQEVESAPARRTAAPKVEDVTPETVSDQPAATSKYKIVTKK